MISRDSVRLSFSYPYHYASTNRRKVVSFVGIIFWFVSIYRSLDLVNFHSEDACYGEFTVVKIRYPLTGII